MNSAACPAPASAPREPVATPLATQGSAIAQDPSTHAAANLAALLDAVIEGSARLVLTRADQPFGSHTSAIATRGLQVMNAPRPIPGAITWMGPCRHGRFYAAVDATTTTALECLRLDAWPVRNLAEPEIRAVLKHLAVEAGYQDLPTIMTDNDLTLRDLEHMYRVPVPGCGVGPEHAYEG
jgi:hypothetical protein